MFGIILFVLGIVLFGSGYFALPEYENTSDRCDEVWPFDKEIDWIGVYCVGCLFVVSGCVLVEI